MRRRMHSRDDGFTFIETAITCILLGLLLMVVAGPWRGYQRRQAHIAATREVVAVLRNAQTKAVAEETSYRVDFASDSMLVWRLTDGTWAIRRRVVLEERNLRYSLAQFEDSSGTGPTVYFYARGSASRGSVRVVRVDSSSFRTVTVEGLTARVSYN